MNGGAPSLKQLLKLLGNYAKATGQLVNLTKSKVLVSKNLKTVDRRRIEKLTKMNTSTLPATYLGACLHQGITRAQHCTHFVQQFEDDRHAKTMVTDGVYGPAPPDPHTRKNRKHKTQSGALVGQDAPVGRKGANSDYGPEAKEPGCPRRPRPRRPRPRQPRPRRPRRLHRTGFYTYLFVQPISGFVFGSVAVQL
ncbi:unnamed protein product [Cuscuta europaea]|uniref:Reverse transcriptase domain-containing protein n=1 Tax=Cuscuta europaea TaxID=41803 RepID=A0A9P0ZC49_CUSEU|nr:unnamed protein product [Cuscuta europaea]